MFIIHLTTPETLAAITALGGFLDNEHDKGADEGPMVQCAEQMIELFAHQELTSFDLTLLQLATLQYACESQGGDEGALGIVGEEDEDEEYLETCAAMRAVVEVIDRLLVGR
jgi:hypothetical protein